MAGTRDTLVDVRRFREDDIPGRIGLLRVLEPGIVISRAGFRHSLATEPLRAQTGMWTAEAGGEVVGVATGRFAWSTEREDLAWVWVGVHPEFRRRGVGSRLYRLAEEHLAARGAHKLESWLSDPAEGAPFAERLGFERRRSGQLWTVDPRTVDVGDLPRLERERAAEGFRLVPLRAVREQERELHRLFAEAAGDMPADEPETNVVFEEWRHRFLDHPDLSLDGSFIAFHGERAASFACLGVDLEGGRASNWLTGTARDYRRRGLARLVKLASTRWAAENGITAIYTGNDATNADMLALNEHLGYRPTTTGASYSKTL